MDFIGPHTFNVGRFLVGFLTLLPFFLWLEFKKIKKKYENSEIYRPLNWGGFIVKPVEYEFWQGRENRLHDRIRYNKKNNKWSIERLSPWKN